MFNIDVGCATRTIKSVEFIGAWNEPYLLIRLNPFLTRWNLLIQLNNSN